jgi:hypothetical protein
MLFAVAQKKRLVATSLDWIGKAQAGMFLHHR